LDEVEKENLRKAVSEANEKLDRLNKIMRERDEVLKDLKEKVSNLLLIKFGDCLTIRFKVTMSLHYSCSTAEVKVSNLNSLLPSSKSLGHTKVDLQPLSKPRNRSFKNSKCSSVKWNEVKESRNDNEVKKIERDELENGKPASEMQARRTTKSRLLWVKVHRTTKVYSLLSPT